MLKYCLFRSIPSSLFTLPGISFLLFTINLDFCMFLNPVWNVSKEPLVCNHPFCSSGSQLLISHMVDIPLWLSTAYFIAKLSPQLDSHLSMEWDPVLFLSCPQHLVYTWGELSYLSFLLLFMMAMTMMVMLLPNGFLIDCLVFALIQPSLCLIISLDHIS